MMCVTLASEIFGCMYVYAETGWSDCGWDEKVRQVEVERERRIKGRGNDGMIEFLYRRGKKQ